MAFWKLALLSYILESKVLNSASFQKAMRSLAREDGEDAATPSSLSDQLDAHAEARQFIETWPTLPAELYDLKRLHNDLRKDVDALREIWYDITTITPARDTKLTRLRELLANELKGQKVLLFTYYKDTARYLYNQLCSDDPPMTEWRGSGPAPHSPPIDRRGTSPANAPLGPRVGSPPHPTPSTSARHPASPPPHPTASLPSTPY